MSEKVLGRRSIEEAIGKKKDLRKNVREIVLDERSPYLCWAECIWRLIRGSIG